MSFIEHSPEDVFIQVLAETELGQSISKLLGELLGIQKPQITRDQRIDYAADTYLFGAKLPGDIRPEPLLREEHNVSPFHLYLRKLGLR